MCGVLLTDKWRKWARRSLNDVYRIALAHRRWGSACIWWRIWFEPYSYWNVLEQSRNGRSSEWLKLRFEHNSTILIGLLLLVVAESMHVPDDVFVIPFSNILAKRMSLCLLVQVAINWCSNVAQCNLYRCIEFPFCAPWARRGCRAMVQQVWAQWNDHVVAL